MPRETIQLPSTNGAIATETTVRWTHEDQGGHVQLCIQRYPDGQVSSPEGAVADAWASTSQILSTVLGANDRRHWHPFVDADGNEGKDHTHTLSKDGTDTCTKCGVPLFVKDEPVIMRGDSIRGSLKDDKVKDAVVGEIDPTKLQPAVSPFGVAVHPEPGVTVELPTRTSLSADRVEFLKQKLAEEGDAIEAAEAGIQSAFSGLRTALPGSYMLPPADGLVGVEPDGSVVLWTDPLDRTAINKLIKVLRRARDQAYGRDE